MTRLKRILITLLVVLLLPALFFSVYEISSLSRNEKMIKSIYEKQLDAILFSANQYADDRLDGWVSQFQKGVQNDSILQQLHQFNASIEYTFLADSMQQHNVAMLNGHDPSVALKIKKLLVEQDSIIQQLNQFYRSGYQKVEALIFNRDSTTSEIMFLFHIQNPKDELAIGGLVVDSEIFIEEVLGPRLQQIAQDQLEVAVIQKGENNSIIYSSTLEDSLSHEDFAYSKDLWLLPDYNLAVATIGDSMQEIVQERTYTNLALLIILDLVILIGIWLIFKNVKRELELAQNKADFVSNVSHELRTPLALIGLFAETLESNRLPSEDKKKEYYSIIHKEANRLTSIVNKILSFSQIDANKKSLNIGEVDLDSLVKEIMQTYEYHLTSHGFDWELTCDSVQVMADKNALEEIIINLLDNAVKYSEDNKYIEIRVGKMNEHGYVSIKDSGVGISRTDLPYIYDKFYRVSSGDLAKKKGTGLGLTLVKQIVTKLNGSIKVESELNKGTTFTVYFPLAAKLKHG